VESGVVPRRIEPYQALRVDGVARLAPGPKADRDGAGGIEFRDDARHVVGGLRIICRHIVERAVGGGEIAFDRGGGFERLLLVRGIERSVGRSAEGFERRLGFGQREACGRDVSRQNVVQLVDRIDGLQAKPIGADRHDAQQSDEQTCLRGNRR
jgi:hypothetical protein